MTFSSLEEYPTGISFRGWNPQSKSLIKRLVVGACMDKIEIFNGDLCTGDTSLEIISGDFVIVAPIIKLPEMPFEDYVKILERCGDTWIDGVRAPYWWLRSDDGLFRFQPERHNIIARLVGISQRRRDLPPLYADEYTTSAGLSTQEYRERLRRSSQPALRAIKRNGLDRTTVFRAAVQS